VVTGTRRIVLAGGITATGLALLFGYHTSTMGASTGSPAAAPVGGGGSGATPAPSSGSTSSSGGGSSGAGGDGTYTGAAVNTQWGPVQVRITVSGGKITDATAVVYPDGNPRDQQINAYALPVLSHEAVAAQSAQIDHVSGATVTSGGYIASLQSAIDQAHL
jgi:uncharacterized protein with FMN-binding domain